MYNDLTREQLEKALSQLEAELEKEQSEKKSLESTAKKVKADFENYKRKENERKEKWEEEAQKNLAEELITVMDNLERAILSAPEDSSIIQGVKMVADQLYEKLERKGLQRIEAEGEEFDPNLHKAIDTEEHKNHNKVLEERRKGYMYNEEVLRESEVVVGKQKESNDS